MIIATSSSPTMQYRHSFHAGNFADVHKHIALLALISALQKKAKGFLFLDTHAGEGLYDLAGADARRSAESEAGIARLLAAAHSRPGALPHPSRITFAPLATLRERLGGSTQMYPGSPLLAATALREADQCVFVETLSQQARALQRVLDQPALQVRTPVRVVTGDGYQQLKALMPPAQRRGLVLIDPPYENAGRRAADRQRVRRGPHALRNRRLRAVVSRSRSSTTPTCGWRGSRAASSSRS